MGVLAAIFATAFAVGLSGAVSPGPVLAATIKGVAKSGFWYGPLVIVGHAILELPVVVGLGLGLGGFLEKQLVLAVISIVGGAVLGIMAAGMLREIRTAILPASDASGTNVTGERGKAVWLGIAASLSNPYWFLWWATAGLALIAWANGLAAERQLPAGLGLSSFYFGHILADLSWYAFISFMLATGRRLFTNKTYRVLIGLCGVFLLWLGGFFLYSGIASFFSRGPIVRQLEKATAPQSFRAQDLQTGFLAEVRNAQPRRVRDNLEDRRAAAFFENGWVCLNSLRMTLRLSIIDDNAKNADSPTFRALHSENRVVERPQPRPRYDNRR
jgi:threonine/homoserine/homoserine lactone efflux protein